MGEYGDSFYYIERGDIFFNLWYVLVLETFWQLAYLGPLALLCLPWVWVGFGASWRGESLFFNSSFMFERTHTGCLHAKRDVLNTY
jgi:hypothetical protein